MTGHSAVLGAGIQERNGAELPPSRCPLTPAPGGGSGVKGTVSPAPQSFRRSRGHSDLQGQLKEEKVEELGGGHSTWAGRGLRARAGCVEASQGEASASPETAGPEAAEPCRPLFNCKDGSSVPLSLHTKAENVCPPPPQPPPFLEGSEDHG